MTHTENAGAEEANKKYTTKEKKVLFVGYRFMITLSLYLFLYSFTIRSFYTPGQRKSRRITLLTVIFRARNKKSAQKGARESKQK